jgi:heme a synthase
MLFMSASTEPGTFATHRRIHWPIVTWLLACAVLVFAMVVLGGVTRLTGSGLSMVEWKPITGVLPPLDDVAWEREFERYKQFPEYLEVNAGMDLAGFKGIYLYEYAHRMLGRTIGIAFLLPMLWFWWRGQLGRALKPHLVALFLLGALQGAMGWYMVMSGLVDEPRVSQYRLTVHLCLAVAIYGYLVFIVLELIRHDPATFMRRVDHPTKLPAVLLVLVFVMIASGGLVAGTRAGHIYNTFPDMHGAWIPEGVLALSPWWINLFENPVTIQFDHRLLAYILLLVAGTARVLLGRSGLTTLVPAMNLLLLLILLQMALGIATLLNHVPVALGAAHQAGALLVFTAAVMVYQRGRHVGR